MSSDNTALTTPFTELVGCRVPIQQAGMSGIGNPPLAAAVAAAGGLGMITNPYDPKVLAEQLESIDAKNNCIGVNFLVPEVDDMIKDLVNIAAENCQFVEFFYGDPRSDLVSQVHEAGALACWQVGSVDEAAAAADSGCDVVVVQGIEAGGHVRGRMPLFPLLEGVLDRVEVPVLAGGGISTARTVAAMLAAGAAGVRVGTRFVASTEASAHDFYKNAIVGSNGSDTTYGVAFHVGWPDAPHRVLQSCIDAASRIDGNVVGHRADGGDILKFSSESPKVGTTGHVDAMALWCGESAGGVKSVMAAGEIVEELASGAKKLLTAWGQAGAAA